LRDMDDNEHFCLRWNDFQSNISATFQSMREEKDFFDVTLACEDRQVQAHKVILSACSPFFRSVLRRNPHQHPLLFLKGVRYSDISSILTFMYHGEVNVTQEDLNMFLSVAEELQIKGLSQDNDKKSLHEEPRKQLNKKPPDDHPEPPVKRPRIETFKSKHSEELVEIEVPEGNASVKVEPIVSDESQSRSNQVQQPAVVQSGGYEVENYDAANYDSWGYEEEQYDSTPHQQEGRMDSNKEACPTESIKVGNSNPEDLIFFEHDPTPGSKKNWKCTLCGEYFHNRGNAMNHVEAKHLDVNYECNQCNKSFRSRNSLKTHTSVYHTNNQDQTRGGSYPQAQVGHGFNNYSSY